MVKDFIAFIAMLALLIAFYNYISAAYDTLKHAADSLNSALTTH